MPRAELTMVFSYDVGADRTRRRVAKALEAVATRVQRSVFEARMSAAEARDLAERIRPMLDETDSLRAYALTKTGRSASIALGGAPLPEDEEFWLL